MLIDVSLVFVILAMTEDKSDSKLENVKWWNYTIYLQQVTWKKQKQK